MHLGYAVLLVLSAPIVHPAPQETPPAPSVEPSPIIVEGSRNREEQITSFIKELTPAPIHGQLSRFESALCPKVNGLADGQARQIEDRMRRVITAIGLPVAKPGCTPNIVVFATDDKQGLLEKIGRSPGAFPDEWSGATIRDFERDPGPVSVWHVEADNWQDGLEVTGNDKVTPVTNMNPAHTEGHTLASAHAVGTRLKPSARRTLAKAVFVIRFDALKGLDPVQVADYALMRTLVRSDPDEVKNLQSNTILNLFNAAPGSPVAASLTAWDLSFLKAFYASTANNYAEYQRSQMKGLMERELDKVQTEQR